MRHFPLCSILLLFLLTACSNSTTTINPSKGNSAAAYDTLLDEKFILGNQTSIGGWKYLSADGLAHDSITPSQFFSGSKPPGDTVTPWSLYLFTRNPPVSFSDDFVALTSGIYTMTVVANDSLTSSGSFSIVKFTNGAWEVPRTRSIPMGMWSTLSVLDTITLTPTDSLRLILSGPNSPQGWTFFNRVVLTKLRQ